MSETHEPGMKVRREVLGDAHVDEVLLHTAVYAGVPAANAAFAIAQQVIEGEKPD
jgi:alkylhydroperoxidase/carboxymuconolactone decarboxylase family protein YurZ